jgi:hypothetical protein
MRSPPTVARYLALIVALSLSSGCVQTVPLTTTSPEAAGLAGRWTGSWRSGATSGNFALQLARGSGDRLTATAVWCTACPRAGATGWGTFLWDYGPTSGYPPVVLTPGVRAQPAQPVFLGNITT